MSESDRLAMLRFLLRVQEQDLARTRRWLEQAERDAAIEAVRERAAAAKRRPEGDWFLSARPSPGAQIWLHADACWDIRPGMIPISREQAIEALAHDVRSCPACRPARDLGVLE